MKYCPYCGKPAENHMESDSDTNASIKSEEIDTIFANLDVALPIYCTIADIQSKIATLNKEKANFSHISGITLFFGAMLYVILLIITGIVFSFIDESASIESLFFMPAVVIIIGYVMYVNKNQKKVQEKIDELEKQLDAYVANNRCEELFYLPEKYRYYMAASYIKECLESGRAKDLSEALNLYEEQMHRWKMENMQYQIYLANLQQVALTRYKL